MLRRFRSLPRIWPGVAPDVILRVDTRPDAQPDVRRGDALAIVRRGTCVHVTCDLMSLDADLAERPIQATLTLHAPGWSDADLEHGFAMFVHKLLQLCEVVRLHGAAVDIDGRTHVLLGDKGAGKSTTSLALGQAGGAVLADDQIVVRRRAGRIVVSGCDSNIRLTEESERHLLPAPLDAAPQDFAGTLKKEVTLEGLVPVIPYQDRHADRVYFPRVGRRFDARPVTGREAAIRILDAIAPAHSFAGPADRWDLLRLVTAFVAPAQCFDVALSPNLGELDQFVAFVRS